MIQQQSTITNMKKTWDYVKTTTGYLIYNYNPVKSNTNLAWSQLQKIMVNPSKQTEERAEENWEVKKKLQFAKTYSLQNAEVYKTLTTEQIA